MRLRKVNEQDKIRNLMLSQRYSQLNFDVHLQVHGLYGKPTSMQECSGHGKAPTDWMVYCALRRVAFLWG